MSVLDKKIDEAAKKFTNGDSGSENPLNDDFLTDDDLFNELQKEFSFCTPEELKELIRLKKSPFEMVREYIRMQISSLSTESSQELVLDRLIASKETVGVGDLAHMVNFEIDLVLNPENESD
jgi:hypothetical protein